MDEAEQVSFSHRIPSGWVVAPDVVLRLPVDQENDPAVHSVLYEPPGVPVVHPGRSERPFQTPYVDSDDDRSDIRLPLRTSAHLDWQSPSMP